MTAFNDTFGIIGLSSENVGIDRRIYTGLTSTNPQLNVSYNGGRVDVYLNGVKLMGNHSGQSNYDYTYQSTGSGSAITLSTGVALVATDTIECVGYVSNSSNTVTTYTPSVSAGNNTFTSISHTSSDLLNVFLNGVLLDPSDYTADASADTVAITSLASGDVVHIQVIGALDHSDFVPESGGTFSGNVAVNGDLTVDTDTLKVDSTENKVGIGTSSPTGGSLHISHGNVLGIYTSGSFNYQAKFESTDSEAGIVIEDNNSTNDGNRIGVIGDNMAFTTANSERVRIDSSGNVELKTTSAYLKLPSGGGINFSAYATSGNPSSNLLDDYEEGTWTASFTGTSDTETAYYTKIGSLVHIQVYSQTLNMSSAATARISGLPFASGVSGRYSVISFTHNTYAPNADNGFVDHLSGTTITAIAANSTAGITTPGTGVAYIMLSGTYMTTS